AAEPAGAATGQRSSAAEPAGAATGQRSSAAIARDGHGLRIRVALVKLDRPRRDATVDAVSARLHALRRDLFEAWQTRPQVLVGGSSLLNQQANQQVQADLSRAESLSLPITLVVLVFVFGGLVAAGLPVLAAVISVASAMTVLLGFSYL